MMYDLYLSVHLVNSGQFGEFFSNLNLVPSFHFSYVYFLSRFVATPPRYSLSLRSDCPPNRTQRWRRRIFPPLLSSCAPASAPEAQHACARGHVQHRAGAPASESRAPGAQGTAPWEDGGPRHCRPVADEEAELDAACVAGTELACAWTSIGADTPDRPGESYGRPDWREDPSRSHHGWPARGRRAA